MNLRQELPDRLVCFARSFELGEDDLDRGEKRALGSFFMAFEPSPKLGLGHSKLRRERRNAAQNETRAMQRTRLRGQSPRRGQRTICCA